MSDDDYYLSLPRRPAGASMLLTGADGRVLLVNPTYKPGWDIPGGVIDEGETPRQAAEREIQEELGLVRKPSRLLVVDWVLPPTSRFASTQFVFDGGTLDEHDLSQIRLPPHELSDWRLAPHPDLDRLLPSPLARRVQAALTARENGLIYLEDAHPVP